MSTQICNIKEGVLCFDVFGDKEVISVAKGTTPCIGFNLNLQLLLIQLSATALLLFSSTSPQ